MAAGPTEPAVSVEDERVFSAMIFCTLSKVLLSTHLEAFVRMKVQDVFNLGNIPHTKALDSYDHIVKSTHTQQSTMEGPTVVE